MAKINEILDARMVEAPVSQAIRDIVDTTGGLTDERYQNNAIDALGGMPGLPWWMVEKGLEYSGKPVDPTLAYFIGRLKLTNDDPKRKGAKTAVQKLIDNYKRDWKDWKETITKDPNLGSKGWKTFQDLWKKAVYDQAEEQTKKNRYDAVHDGSVASFITRTLFPRSTERIASTGDYETKDMVLDLAENGLMSVPGAGWAKAAGMAGRKVLPSAVLRGAEGVGKAVNAMKGANSAAANAIGYGLGALPNLAGNTFVPLAMEVADDIAYDPGEGMDDRANFSIGDVALGGAINQAVNQGLVRELGPLIGRYSGELRNRGSERLRNLLNTLGRSQRSLGQDVVNEARSTLASPVVRTFDDGTRLTKNELGNLQLGTNVIPEGVGVEKFLEAQNIDRIAKMMESGDLTYRDAQTIAGKFAKAEEKAVKRHEKLADDLFNEAEDLARSGDFEGAAAVKAQGDNVLELAHSGKQLSGVTPSNVLKGINNVHDLAADRALNPEGVRTLLMENPGLFNYAYWQNAGTGAKLQNLAHQAWPSLVINKAGRDEHAKQVAKAFTDEIEENRKESKDAAKKLSVSKVLEAGVQSGALTEEDKKWLSKVKDNPDIVTLGLNSDNASENDAFKMWLLTGGNDLLRGTEAHRPIWEVE